MPYISHRLRVKEKKVFKKLFWSFFIFIGSGILAVYAGLPLLAKIAIGLSRLGNNETAVEKTGPGKIFKPIVDPLPVATNSANIRVSGFSEKERKIFVLVNGQETVNAYTDDEGKFKFSSIMLNPGENKIEVIAEFQDNRSEATEYYVTYKNEPPNLEVSQPEDGQIFISDNKTEIIGITDSGNSVSINDHLIIVDKNGNFRYQVTLSSGENSFMIKAEDEAGNNSQKEIKVNYSP